MGWASWSVERRRRWTLFALLALSLLVLWRGWLEFWFLTDDAFITFRYISNRQLGLGYVWNAPPFRPVEGYSNFLWMVLLDAVWSVLRIEPPAAANTLSLVCAGLATWRIWSWSSASTTSASLARPLLALGLLLSNRTFLTWSSSGLETSLFNLLLLLWFEQAWRHGDQRRGSPGFALLCLWASLAALTRPDGLLLFGATVVMALLPRTSRRGSAGWFAGAGLSLSLVPLHLLWRRSTYGEWLPNTYYAKHVAPWPEAGLKYLVSFVLEYGYWACGLAALGLLFARFRRPSMGLEKPSLFRPVAVATFLAHTAYYVLRVGGDHFEYRVLSHWVPLLALAWATLLVGLSSVWLRVTALALSLLAALPIQWAHWSASRVLTTRNQTWKLKVPVAPLLGSFVAPLTEWFDTQQAWLIEHHVCMRHQEHKVFGEEQRRSYPARQQVGSSGEDLPVIALTTVGVPGWAYPNVAVIDLFGLNDYVVARTPVSSDHFRLMAHDRHAPPDYVDCFRPNVVVGPAGVARVEARPEALTFDMIRGCERDYLTLVQGVQESLPVLVASPAQGTAAPLTPELFADLAGSDQVLLRQTFDGPGVAMEQRGIAFGEGPGSSALPSQQAISGASGRYLNSYHRGDLSTGMISFALPQGTTRVALKLAGGANCQSLFVGLVEGDHVLVRACGKQSEELQPVLLSVEPGHELRFIAFDGSSESWGHLIVDDVIALGPPPPQR